MRFAKRRRSRSQGEVLTLRDGLAAYWKLDEASGEIRVDSSNGLELEEINSVTVVPGKLGNAVEVAYVDYDRWFEINHPLMAMSGDFTLSCWVHRIGSVHGADTIISLAGNVFLYTHVTHDHGPVFLALDGDWNEIVYLAGNDVITVGIWHHLVVFRNGSTFGIVTNGGAPSTLSGVGDIPGTAFRIGAHEGGFPFTGSIDEVGKWDRALSLEEISQLYNAGAGLAFEEF